MRCGFAPNVSCNPACMPWADPLHWAFLVHKRLNLRIQGTCVSSVVQHVSNIGLFPAPPSWVGAVTTRRKRRAFILKVKPVLVRLEVASCLRRYVCTCSLRRSGPRGGRVRLALRFWFVGTSLDRLSVGFVPGLVRFPNQFVHWRLSRLVLCNPYHGAAFVAAVVDSAILGSFDESVAFFSLGTVGTLDVNRFVFVIVPICLVIKVTPVRLVAPSLVVIGLFAFDVLPIRLIFAFFVFSRFALVRLVLFFVFVVFMLFVCNKCLLSWSFSFLFSDVVFYLAKLSFL